MKPIVIIESTIMTKEELNKAYTNGFFKQYLSFEAFNSELIAKCEYKDLIGNVKKDEVVIFGKKRINGSK